VSESALKLTKYVFKIISRGDDIENNWRLIVSKKYDDIVFIDIIFMSDFANIRNELFLLIRNVYYDISITDVKLRERTFIFNFNITYLALNHLFDFKKLFSKPQILTHEIDLDDFVITERFDGEQTLLVYVKRFLSIITKENFTVKQYDGENKNLITIFNTEFYEGEYYVCDICVYCGEFMEYLPYKKRLEIIREVAPTYKLKVIPVVEELGKSNILYSDDVNYSYKKELTLKCLFKNNKLYLKDDDKSVKNKYPDEYRYVSYKTPYDFETFEKPEKEGIYEFICVDKMWKILKYLPERIYPNKYSKGLICSSKIYHPELLKNNLPNPHEKSTQFILEKTAYNWGPFNNVLAWFEYPSSGNVLRQVCCAELIYGIHSEKSELVKFVSEISEKAPLTQNFFQRRQQPPNNIEVSIIEIDNNSNKNNLKQLYQCLFYTDKSIDLFYVENFHTLKDIEYLADHVLAPNGILVICGNMQVFDNFEIIDSTEENFVYRRR
jgi:hypothetical protein